MLRTAFLTIGAALLLCGTASAATTVAHDGTTTTIVGDAESDDVLVTITTFGTGPAASRGVRITNGQGVNPGPGCVPEGTTAAVCPVRGGGVSAQLGDGADQFRFAETYEYSVLARVQGQGGNDTLNGSYSGELHGGDGDDTLRPLGYGSQRITGGGGTDTLTLALGGYVMLGDDGSSDVGGGTQADTDVEHLQGSSGEDYFVLGSGVGGGHTFDGGPGHDTISYAQASGPVEVVLDGTGTHRLENMEGAVGTEGSDELEGTSGANELIGGGGDDRLVGGDGTDSLLGGAGDDTIVGGGGSDEVGGAEGNDRIDGGPGEELLSGGSGGDVLRGGADKDTVSYLSTYSYYDDYYYGDDYYAASYQSSDSTPSVPGVTVSLDDHPNDGTTGEGDDVGSDVEVIRGTEGDDTLTGGPNANEISGFGGRDRIDGVDGDDKVHGGDDDDILGGGAGNDEVRGGGGSDQMSGGPGEDLAIPHDEGTNVDGVDLLEMRDGERDAIACPAGLSRVLVDQHDIVDDKCALVERFTIGAAGQPAPPVGPSPLLRIHLKGTVVDRRGVARIRATCAPAPVPCAGRLSLFTLHKRKLAKLGRRVFAIPAGRTRTVPVKLNKLGRRLVRARRSVRTQVFVSPDDPKARPIRIARLGLRRARR